MRWIDWIAKRCDGVMIYSTKIDDIPHEIRAWPYDDSGDGRFQLCKDGMHVGNFTHLRDAKDFATEMI